MDEQIILGFNYWENFKFDKELAMVLPVDDPKRIRIHAETNKILEEWNKTKNNE